MLDGSVALRDHRMRRWQSSVLGWAADLVGCVGQPLDRGGGNDALGDHGIALGRTEFGLQISLPVDAFARNPGIEEIRPPMDVDRDIGNERQRIFQPALADEAPGANHVGDDVDAKRGWRAGRNRHDKPPCGCFL
jgi:hypothetical protein